ncbi:DUF2235 domain-containing protein [Rhizobium laguerreae]|uniref:DUF2235 domain-containing protein n=1 Tax=Rhizobium laguerreae TaxID=1076926 RepID=UPI001C9049DE|nr:DUF2235 domain-containing protein [Rhizobium laguerreae]MBY3084850.1 DUF2235 domain-containing protein [Rhizobium laguerreae]MBY3145712.1 DUF2235 domain-containing protein [Rhizobium laguerreae]
MNLVICCDGTWNTPNETEGGLPSPTNVVKLYNALAPADPSGTEQKAYYHPGVGTDGTWWDKFLGGGTGKGLDQNIMSAYRWLALNYTPGDPIWLFGFSRGAYTVRSLGGMISKCGLVDLARFASKDDALWKVVQKIFDAYRDPKPSPLRATKAMPFFNAATGENPSRQTPIHFIGVWDTVGSLGIPDDMGFLNLLDDPDDHRFHDTTLSPIVGHARHAVGLDEKRQSFIPTLWTSSGPQTDMKQLWFPGVHGDVGGGYSQSGLSDGALYWMMKEAAAEGLAFRQDALLQLKPNPRGVLHDSVHGLFKALKTRPRAAPLVAGQSLLLHASAIDRHANPPLDQGAYWPLKANLPVTVDIFARDRWNYTGVYLKKDLTYKLTATGQWLDASIRSGPEGTDDGSFQIGEVAQIASSILGGLETLTQKLTKNEQIDFWWTRREEKMPWFALVGLLANDIPPPKRTQVNKSAIERLPHEVFLIGDGAPFTPQADGYLYCFANDAWQAYDNNKGSVQLTIAS